MFLIVMRATLLYRKKCNTIKSAKFKFYSSCFDNNKDNPKGIWKTIKSLTGASAKKETARNALNDDTGSKSAENFNNHFASTADRLRALLPQVPFDISKLENFVLSRKDPAIKVCIPPVKKGFVMDNLLPLKSNKAMGFDKISARMLKIAAPVIAPSVVKIMNFSLESAVFLKRWKTAKVTPLYKSGDRNDVNNYRPVSVLPALSKDTGETRLHQLL